MKARAYILPLLLLGEFALFARMSGVEFDSLAAFRESFSGYAVNLIEHAAPLLILVFGMTIVLMTAGIDLSVAASTTLVACVMSTFEGGPSFWYTAIPAGLGLALALGLFNGLLIARFDVPPIIATLGTLFFYRGLCEIVMGGKENAPFLDVPGYLWFSSVTGVAVVAGSILVLGGTYFWLSRWRREILMLGGNRIAARYAGIPVARRQLQVYTLMGLLAFPAALCYTAKHGAVSSSSLPGWELRVIVAVVLGGTSVAGGSGTLVGSVLGVFMIAVLDEGLRGAAAWQSQFPFQISHLEFILMGLLLVVGVWLNTHAGQLRRVRG